jgi:1,3-alpha-isomaltosidase
VIRHRPFGRGHPYVVDPDQRFPARPSAGAAFDLGIVTGMGARGVEVDFGATRAAMTCLGDAVARDRSEWGAATHAGDGHLTEALTPEEGVLAWTYRHPGLAEGETLRYRFLAGDEATDWFSLACATWSAEGGPVDVVGAPERLMPGTEWLGDGDAVYAARFRLRLEPGERLVGFGERFDGLDQRGKRLEAVVFDQYKGQGARSYLPMPFGIVVGGRFGFWVETGHRVRFDVGASDPAVLLVEVDLEPGEAEPAVRLRLFAGEPAEVQAAFLALAGAPPAPPEWVFRLWMSGNAWNTQERLLKWSGASTRRSPSARW